MWLILTVSKTVLLDGGKFSDKLCRTENEILSQESVLSITIMSTGPDMYAKQLGTLFKFLVILI